MIIGQCSSALHCPYTRVRPCRGSDKELFHTARTFEDYDDFSTTSAGGTSGMKRLVSKTEAYEEPGQPPQTTTYSYIDTPFSPTTHGRLSTELRPDGAWRSYE